MRLICPNCGAQYAVADDVIPAAGRDVQCSNCAHTWFETPGASADDRPPAPRRPSAPKVPEPDKPAETAPYTGSIEDAFKETVEADPAAKAAPKRRSVDPDVADILREEAARETQIRRTETPAPMENQSDLGLDAPARPRTTAQIVDEPAREAAKTAAAATGAVTAATANVGSRRELLPDIEEINSSLKSDPERADGGDGDSQSAAERERRGFRRAFILMLIIFAVLVSIYVQAEAIVAAVPALAGVMDSYVGVIDAARIWLDETVRGLVGETPPAE